MEEAIAHSSGNRCGAIPGGTGAPRPSDLRNRDATVVRLLPLARRLARHYAGGPEQMDDLEQVAYVGAVKAVSRFDPGRGTSLAQFAAPFIHGELKHHLRDNLGLPRVPRAMQSKAIKVVQVERTLFARLGRRAEPEEIAALTGLTKSDVLACQELATAQRTRSLNAGSKVGSPSPLDALAEDDERLELVEYRHSLSRILRSLEARERSLLYLRLGLGRSLRESAKALGISVAQASRLFRHGLEKARTIAAAVEQPSSDGRTGSRLHPLPVPCRDLPLEREEPPVESHPHHGRRLGDRPAHPRRDLGMRQQ